ncbi:MAG: NADH-quinone oxidoreductase subunit N [Alphaproteobacteria bacterium]|nr:NADH-quinone oxidoreductase subunit N [Alphaproteobacteria bacterium]
MNYLIIYKYELFLLISIVYLVLVILFSKILNSKQFYIQVCVLAMAGLALHFLPLKPTLLSPFFIDSPKTNFIKLIVQLGTLLIVFQSFRWFINHEDKPCEFYILLFAAVLGIDLIISANHILIFYIALELVTFPLILLCGFNFRNLKSSESALKFFWLNALATGFILFGLSIMYMYKTDFSVAAFINLPPHYDKFYLINFIFVIAGISFKIGLAPFHNWAIDVYDGAPTPISFTLNTIPKIAYLLFFIKLVTEGIMHTAEKHMLLQIITILALASITIGNVFALRTQKIKRFLAYSSISQLGIVLFGILTSPAVANTNFMYFMISYLCTNFIVFYIINKLEIERQIQTWSDLKSLVYTDKFSCLVLVIGFVSLAGVPPSFGFFSKYYLILGAQYYGKITLILILLNLIIALIYYFNIIKLFFQKQHTINELNIIQPFYRYETFILVISCFVILCGGFFTDFYVYLFKLFS